MRLQRMPFQPLLGPSNLQAQPCGVRSGISPGSPRRFAVFSSPQGSPVTDARRAAVTGSRCVAASSGHASSFPRACGSTPDSRRRRRPADADGRSVQRSPGRVRRPKPVTLLRRPPRAAGRAGTRLDEGPSRARSRPASEYEHAGSVQRPERAGKFRPPTRREAATRAEAGGGRGRTRAWGEHFPRSGNAEARGGGAASRSPCRSRWGIARRSRDPAADRRGGHRPQGGTRRVAGISTARRAVSVCAGGVRWCSRSLRPHRVRIELDAAHATSPLAGCVRC